MTAITDETKKTLLDVHFEHEVRMMMEGVSYFKPDGSVLGKDLEAFLVHIRILYEFFYGSGRGNKSHAGHYLDSWKNRQIPSELKKWNAQINNFLSHLSYERVTGQYQLYPVMQFYTHFRQLVIDFLTELPDEYKSLILEQLLKDIKG